jgi:hypothetical protein
VQAVMGRTGGADLPTVALVGMHTYMVCKMIRRRTRTRSGHPSKEADELVPRRRPSTIAPGGSSGLGYGLPLSGSAARVYTRRPAGFPVLVGLLRMA